MSTVTSGLKSVNDLLDYHFYIPSYQRGYRWSEYQVKDLLDDIEEFDKRDKAKSEFYCLQPIVISSASDGKLNVIDGQQRLTTIHIILSYLKDLLPILGKKKYKIEYQTRPNSEAFLDAIDSSKKEENIDYYHIVEAYETVSKWFEERDGSVKLKFLQALLGHEDNNVRVIWYELSSAIKPIEVFTRLNMGKIGLTNGELIKAVFLSTSHKLDQDQDKNEVIHRLNQIATEWDGFEAQLRNEEFWGFLQNDNVEYHNHIEFLFDLIAKNFNKGGKRKNQDNFYTFRHFSEKIKSSKSAQDEWKKVKRLFQQLHDWYTNRELYHLIGFLISAGEDLGSIIDLSEGSTKRAFAKKIKELISNQVPKEIEHMTYQDDKKKLRKTLLLFNILSILENPKTNLRFQFGRYKLESWDIEHIHSVSSEMPTHKAHQIEWLKEVLKYTEDTKLKKSIRIYLETKAGDRTDDFETIYSEVTSAYSNDENNDINDVSNLTLLDSGTNRGYKNAVFPIKRKTIIEKDERGTFIPLCTKNVFLKYYNKNIDQTTFWGEKDRSTYKQSLIDTINNYLKEDSHE